MESSACPERLTEGKESNRDLVFPGGWPASQRDKTSTSA